MWLKKIINPAHKDESKKKEEQFEKVVQAAPVRRAVGISGIEKRIEHSDQRNQFIIDQAFEDTKILMNHARDLVNLSKKITERLKDHGLAEDETVQFKSYLLSLGVEDPVTKDEAGSSSVYYDKLAMEISKVILGPIKECGGIMTMPEVYCRINRARGVELISPDDLLHACQRLDKLNSPLTLHSFKSGVQVIQLRSANVNSAESVNQTVEVVTANNAVDKVTLAQILGIPMVLAMEKLLAAEAAGKICRDETIEGLLFYPNRFAEL